nr:GNAT family N-acetyltransferase [Bifidobacterium pseudolongum]
MGLNTIDDSREGIIRYLERNPNTCFVDEQEGTITGAIFAGHDGRRGYIYHTAVNPAYRRQGIGTALVSAALHAPANEGICQSRPRRFLTQRCRQCLLGALRFHCARRSDLPQQSPVRHHPHRHMSSLRRHSTTLIMRACSFEECDCVSRGIKIASQSPALER